MRHVSPEYHEQLRQLAGILCPAVQVEEYHPFQIVVEDSRTGYDQDGNFHTSRTTGQNRWDSLGAYVVDL